MGHTPAMLAAIEAQPTPAPHVGLDRISLDVDFIWVVVGPEGPVSPADGAEAFEGGFAEGREGDADCFAVTGYGL